MESFLAAMGDRIGRGSLLLQEACSEDLHRLYFKAYSEASRCFETSGRFAEAMNCGQGAMTAMMKFEADEAELLKNVERPLRACTGKCGLNQQANLSDELKKCLTTCEEEVLARFKALTPDFITLVKRHSR